MAGRLWITRNEVRMEREVVRTVGGEVWHVDGELADVLFPSAGPSGEGLVAAVASGRVVKEGRGRRISRVEIGGRGFFVKEYLGRRFLRRPARREWRIARWAWGAGLPTPRPVAACWAGRQFVVTAESAGAKNLSDLILDGCFEVTEPEPPHPGHRPPELVRAYRRRRTTGIRVPHFEAPTSVGAKVCDAEHAKEHTLAPAAPGLQSVAPRFAPPVRVAEATAVVAAITPDGTARPFSPEELAAFGGPTAPNGQPQ
jgi:hypothetical protein